MNRNHPESIRQRVVVPVDAPRGRPLEAARVFTGLSICACKRFLSVSLQFDEEFSARQEAQAESQKKDEKIKELEEKIQALESQVNPISLQNTYILPARTLFFLMPFFSGSKRELCKPSPEAVLITFKCENHPYTFIYDNIKGLATGKGLIESEGFISIPI